jgi:hypothetical protein
VHSIVELRSTEIESEDSTIEMMFDGLRVSALTGFEHFAKDVLK